MLRGNPVEKVVDERELPAAEYLADKTSIHPEKSVVCKHN
jgi:hypothetical protein